MAHRKNNKSNFKSNNSRYQFEIGSEAYVTNKVKKQDRAPQSLKHDPEATGANIAGAFSAQPSAKDTEFGSDTVAHEIKSMKQQTKQRFQEDLQQSFNVEFAEEDKIIDRNRNCDNC